MNELISVGDKVVIRYKGDIVNFGQCYDGMTGTIIKIYVGRYKISLSNSSRKKLEVLDDSRIKEPLIPFQYVYVYNKSLEIE